MRSRVEVESAMGVKEEEEHLGRLSKVILDCLSGHLRNLVFTSVSEGRVMMWVPVLGFSYILGLFIPLFVEKRALHAYDIWIVS